MWTEFNIGLNSKSFSQLSLPKTKSVTIRDDKTTLPCLGNFGVETAGLPPICVYTQVIRKFSVGHGLV